MTAPAPLRIAAALTCFNRRDQTLACLQALQQQRDVPPVDVVLVDDGSTDGTGAAVTERFPEATVIYGDGQLFWAPGMRLALQQAYARDCDFYLWLNDDTMLDPGALATLIQAHDEVVASTGAPAVVVGATRDPGHGWHTYGGRRQTNPRRPLAFAMVPLADEPVACDTFNGNVVLVSREVVRRVGNIDPAYRHSMGYFDYGLRARAAGCTVHVAPGTLATCASNPPVRWGTRPLRKELQTLVQRRAPGLPPTSWATFTRRWAGPGWPLYFASPYLRECARIVAAHVR